MIATKKGRRYSKKGPYYKGSGVFQKEGKEWSGVAMEDACGVETQEERFYFKMRTVMFH